MKFLCDQMLASLGKWLRAAGYDTEIITDQTTDRIILDMALKENRLLLTRDRHFLTLKPENSNVIFLKGNSIKTCITELNEKLTINWLLHPFSRCLVCNSLLSEPNEELINKLVPADVRMTSNAFRYCTQCKKIYWEGSHTQRMFKQLQKWQHS